MMSMKSFTAFHCEYGAEYIGETGHGLKTRLSEHKEEVRHEDWSNGLAVHVASHQTFHQIGRSQDSESDTTLYVLQEDTRIKPWQSGYHVLLLCVCL